MQKNVASQKVMFFAFDSTTNAPKTGDAANITPYVSKDYGSVTAITDTSASEMDSTNAKGFYLVDLTQGETNADTLLFSAKSSTANIVVVGAPAVVFTDPPNYSALNISSGKVLVQGTIDQFDDFVTAAGKIAALDDGTITAGVIAANAITAAKVADGTIDAATFAAGAIDATAIAANAITAAKIADGAIDNATFAADVGSTAIATNVIGIAAKKGVVDALNVDTYAEPAQGAPPATATFVQKVGYLFKFARNKVTQDATTLKVYNDDAATVDHKATVSDDATTYTRGEIGTGP